jgi:hypothetical protein
MVTKTSWLNNFRHLCTKNNNISHKPNAGYLTRKIIPWINTMNFRLYKRHRIPWLAGRLLTSQRTLCWMALVLSSIQSRDEAQACSDFTSIFWTPSYMRDFRFSRRRVWRWRPIIRAMNRSPDDRGSTHLRNVGLLQWDYKALFPRNLSPCLLQASDIEEVQTLGWILLSVLLNRRLTPSPRNNNK